MFDVIQLILIQCGEIIQSFNYLSTSLNKTYHKTMAWKVKYNEIVILCESTTMTSF